MKIGTCFHGKVTKIGESRIWWMGRKAPTSAIGLIAENNSHAWVVRWSDNERTLFSVR